MRQSRVAVRTGTPASSANGIVKLSEVGTVANHISLMRHI